MRILILHNRYREAGGEDRVVEEEAVLLSRHGHEVFRHEVTNEDIDDGASFGAAFRSIWNRDECGAVRRAIQSDDIDLVHVHNTLAVLSPAVLRAASGCGVPVVQTLHNYRLVCPSAVLFREGRLCTSCVGRALPLPGVVHGCYRDSRAATGVVAAGAAVHGALGTWRRHVDAFITLSRFSRDVFAEAGLADDRLHVKPNFVDPDLGPGSGAAGTLLFVGRLTAEKGVRTLLDALDRLAERAPSTVLLGDGPLASEVAERVEALSTTTWLGQVSAAEVARRMGEAAALVVPSEWPEPFGRVAVEALARGTPVIAARSGALPELVDHGRTGRLFTSGDADALASEIEGLFEDPRRLTAMRGPARDAFDASYTADRNYGRLIEIYSKARAAHALRRRAATAPSRAQGATPG